MILISSPSWFFIAACGPWMSLALASCRAPRKCAPLPGRPFGPGLCWLCEVVMGCSPHYGDAIVL